LLGTAALPSPQKATSNQAEKNNLRSGNDFVFITEGVVGFSVRDMRIEKGIRNLM
jgi:hypothetical protein